MEDNAINIIRESTRNLIKLNRRIHKDEESDSRRCIKEKRVSPENISEIANTLKTKTAISVTDLQILKNGLMEDTKYVEIVLNVHGALRGLIRELTGHNVNKQVAAAGCCCNLALGGLRACTVVSKAAGSYLSAALDSFTTELAVTCAWALGNLAGASAKVCDILISQGAMSKLSDFHSDQDLQDASLYALAHFTYQMKDDLKMDHMNKILQMLMKVDITTAAMQLTFILSCHSRFIENINEELSKKILEHLPAAINAYIDRQTDDKLLYMLRSLANMNKFYCNILNFIETNNLYAVLKVLLNNNDSVNESLCWLLGNLYNFCDNKELLCKLCS